MTRDQEEFPPPETENIKGRKPYIAPELVVHGAVEKLTETTGRAGQADDGMGKTRSA